MVDPLQTALNILSTNWQNLNTDSLTPKFIKITDKKRYDYRENQDVIIAHRSRPTQEPAGVGVLGKHITEQFDIDIRVLGKDQEDHWRKVIAEVDRIFDANIKNPTADYTILDPDSQRQDLSDKTYNLWRLLMPIKLIKYNQAR